VPPSLDARPSRHPDLAWRCWDGEVVILAPAGHDPALVGTLADGAEHDLNDVASFIWELCDGAHSVAEIVTAVQVEFDVDEATARADAAQFVDELVTRKLLVVSP
jgi:hypothetical protein